MTPEVSSSPVQTWRVADLIVNADDFGFNHEITDGIVESHHNGVVTSTTLMVNMPGCRVRSRTFTGLPRHVDRVARKSDGGASA